MSEDWRDRNSKPLRIREADMYERGDEYRGTHADEVEDLPDWPRDDELVPEVPATTPLHTERKAVGDPGGAGLELGVGGH